MAYQDQFYTTGRIAVTKGSAAVTSTGTGWQTALVDGGVLYVNGAACPILSVQSETKLTLAIPYTGDTGTNLVYAIDRQRAAAISNIAMNDRLAVIINSIETAQPNNKLLTAFAALTGVKADQLAYFTGAESMSTTAITAFVRTLLAEANASGVYGKLGVVPEAQTPLRIRGVYNGAAVSDCNAFTESGWAYFGGSGAINTPLNLSFGMLFNVFQIPTHGIQFAFDRGDANNYCGRRTCNNGNWSAWRDISPPIVIENANGRAVRYNDGTQLCYSKPIELTIAGVTSGTAPWTFPATFMNAEAVVTPSIRSADLTGTERRGFLLTQATTVASATFQMLSEGTYTVGKKVTIQASAIGRWR